LPAYDFLEINRWLALVLAFDGVFTVDRLAGRLDGFDIQAVLFVTHAIFDALAHAHAKKDCDGQPLVHGDVHPANVLVRRTGHVLLRGFRGAEPTPPGRPELEPRIALGPYGAPELADGLPATTASDLYGAASVAWHLIVGRPRARHETTSLAHIRPDLSPEVAAVLDVCLSFEPSRRRLRAATMAATVCKAVDLEAGRDSLERLYLRVLRRLPAAVRDLCAGALSTRGPSDSSIRTQAFRLDPADSGSRLVVPSPVRETIPTESNSIAIPDDPSVERPSLLGRVEPKALDCASNERDTLADCPARNLRGTGKVQDTVIEVGDDDIEASVPCSQADAGARSLPIYDAALRAPQSLRPVASDSAAPEIVTSPRRAIWGAITAAVVLLLVPVSWMVGRQASPPPIGRPAVSNGVVTPSVVTPSVVTPSVVTPSVSAPPRDVPPNGTQPSKEPPKTQSLASTFVPFHQSSLLLEGPPDGVVFINGVESGRTGERFVTRGCGLRFVRVASERGERGFRWLNRGQTAHLPCGGSVTIRALKR